MWFISKNVHFTIRWDIIIIIIYLYMIIYVSMLIELDVILFHLIALYDTL